MGAGGDGARVCWIDPPARVAVVGVIAAGHRGAVWPRPMSRRRCPWPLVVVPLLALVAMGLAEIGSLIVQASALHRGLGAAASYAARGDLPLSAAARRRVENIVVTGVPNGGAPPIVPGWAEAGAEVQIQELSYSIAGTPVSAVRISVTVPYKFLFGGLLPIPAFNLELSRDRAVIAD